MKISHQKSSKIILLFISILGMINVLQAQDVKQDKNSVIKELIDSKNYVFIAEIAQPTTGSNRRLDYGYQLQVASDSLISDLPYFGRAYSAPIDASQGGFRFTTTDFAYTVKETKKGGWNILIKPKTANDVRQMYLDILPGGRATLQVLSNNKQGISFDGYVTERKK